MATWLELFPTNNISKLLPDDYHRSEGYLGEGYIGDTPYFHKQQQYRCYFGGILPVLHNVDDSAHVLHYMVAITNPKLSPIVVYGWSPFFYQPQASS